MGAKTQRKEDAETLLLKSEEPPPPKASLRQLFRYASGTDKLLLGLGVLVAIGTGFGWPLMAVVTGNISRNFINVGRRLALNNSAEELEVVLQDFNAAALQSCYDYIYLGCGVFTVGTLQVVCFLTVCENMVHTLRRQFFHAVLRQDIAWFDKNSSGSLTPKLFDNIERVKEGTGDKLGLLLQYVSQFFGGFAIAFFYDWKLTLIMMALTPFMILSGAVIAKIMSSAATRETKKYAIAGGIAEEVLSSMRTVIAFNGQERECARYNSALEDGKKVGIKKAIFQGAGMAMLFFIMFSSYALAFWVGTNFVYDGTMDGGTVMTVFFAVMLGSMALGQAGPQLAVLGTAMGAAATLYQIIDRTPDIDGYSKEGVEPKELQGKLVLDNVQFAYPSRPDQHVLKGISFEANPGETVALVGSSGCGKSTVIQLLLRYYNALSGTLCIDGININKFNIEQLRKYIGVVSQEPMLFNTTIEQNIRYGNSDITENDILAALRRANAYDFVKNLPDGLKTLVGDHGTQMSGGQKQRIAIARALVRDPKILLLDEATSALDAESEHIVQKALENASKGRTTIVIAHRLSTIRNADKIVAIKDGEVIEIGSHADLLKNNGLYHDLVNSQVFADVDSNEQNIYDRMESTLSARSQVSSVIDGREMKSRTDTSRLSISEKSKKKPQNDLERLKKEVEEEGVAKASLWRILRYARSEWALLFGAVLAACFMGCVTPVFSLLFTQIIDVFSNPDRDQMKRDGHWVSLLFLGLGIVQGVFMMTQAFLFGLSSERITYRLRSKIFRNIMRMDAAYFDMPKHSPGKIATRLATDAPNVKSAIDYRLGTVFSAAVSVFFGLGLALYFGWQMALLVMAIFPLAGIGRSIQIKYVSGQATGDARAMENSGKVAMEAIENIRTVQALTLEKLLFEQFCEHLDGPHRNSRKKAIMQAFSYGFATSIVFFLYGASFRFGIWLIAAGYLSPIRVLRVLFAISFSAGSLGTASAYFPEYIKATFAAGLIFRMLEEEPGIDNTSKAGAKPKIEGHLHLNNVYFKYPQRPLVPILQGVDIQVRPGKTLALVGSSGCGKSTVVSLLERLYDTLDGQVLIDGHDIRELNPIYFRSFIALVSQEPLLFDTSIRENIVYGLTEGTYTEDDIVRAATEANVHTFITELSKGYDTEVGEKGTQLSGGQKQRIAIARALIRNPKILLLDEATSALDTESEKLVQRALDKASEGRTCIIVAHRLSTVINADCIMVMSDGKVVEQGSHSELMSLKGAYWRLNQRQNVSS